MRYLGGAGFVASVGILGLTEGVQIAAITGAVTILTAVVGAYVTLRGERNRTTIATVSTKIDTTAASLDATNEFVALLKDDLKIARRDLNATRRRATRRGKALREAIETIAERDRRIAELEGMIPPARRGGAH